MAHEGWRNQQTWTVNLWICNDEGINAQCESFAQGAMESTPVLREQCREVEHAIKAYVEETVDVILGDKLAGSAAAFILDLIQCTLAEVDWDQIATSFVETARENAERNGGDA